MREDSPINERKSLINKAKRGFETILAKLRCWLATRIKSTCRDNETSQKRLSRKWRKGVANVAHSAMMRDTREARWFADGSRTGQASQNCATIAQRLEKCLTTPTQSLLPLLPLLPLPLLPLPLLPLPLLPLPLLPRKSGWLRSKLLSSAQ